MTTAIDDELDAARQKPGKLLVDAGWVWRRYQRKLFADKARLIVVVKSRQIGMSEAGAALAVSEAMSTAKRAVWILSVNLASGKEVIRKCLQWCRVFAACDAAGKLPTIVRETTEGLELSNGSRITVLPCTARAVRGKTGTVIWDEAAHAQGDEEIYTAIAPVIASNPHLRMILISTAFGDRGVFYRAYHGKLDTPSLKWSKHRIDVNDAVRDGFPASVLDLRGTYTEDAWAQEFLCAFNSQKDRYYPVQLIKKCYAVELAPDMERVINQRVISIDVASKADTSVAVIVDEDGDQNFHIHSPVVLSTSQDRRTYPQQFTMLCDIIGDGEDYTNIVIDANGVGAGLASMLRERYGSKVVEFIPSASWKSKYIPGLKYDMEAGNVEIEPVGVLTTAFNAVKEIRTANNVVVFRAPRDDSGHADGYSASLMGYAHLKRWPDAQQAPAVQAGGRKTSERAKLSRY